MKKFILGMLTITALMMFTGCAEEEETPVAPAPKYAVKLADSAVLDAEKSYFLITVDNAKRVDNVTLKREQGETDASYNYRYEKAVGDAIAKGVHIEVQGNGLDTKTTVLNKDNGTLIDITKPVLVLVKERLPQPSKPGAKPTGKGSYQIQILIKADAAINARSIYLTVDKQKFLYNNFAVKPARIYTDEFGNPVTSLNVPDDVRNDRGEVIKKGYNLISLPNNVNVYTYDSNTKEAVGPVKAGVDVTGNVDNTKVAAPFVISDYSVKTTANTKGFESCLKDGKTKCGINVSGYEITGTDRKLILKTETVMDAKSKLSVPAVVELPLYGSKNFGYHIAPRASSFLDVAESVAVFDIEIDKNHSNITVDNISVANESFTKVTEAEQQNAKLEAKQYVVKNGKIKNKFELIMLASSAATQAATVEGLIINIDGSSTVFTSSQIKANKIAEAFIDGVKLDKPYQLTYDAATGSNPNENLTNVTLKINSFGKQPTLYTYNGKDITATVFNINLKQISATTGVLSITAKECKQDAVAVDCVFAVSAVKDITADNSATDGKVTITFEDQQTTSAKTQLPETTIQFFTTNATAAPAEPEKQEK